MRLNQIKPAAGRFDRSARTFAHAEALQSDLALNLAREDHFGAQREMRDDARGFQRGEIDHIAFDLLQVAQAHFSGIGRRQRHEAAFRETPLERHLTAFEADLMEAACARLLTFVAPARRLSEPATDAASDALLRVFRARSGLQLIELHFRS